MPKFSVIIPVYNVQKYLRSCLDSIVNQKYSDYEIVLIDDGSIDESGNICDEYAKKFCNITVLHQENSGVSIARKNGIKIARGEYLLFVDSDDFVKDNFFNILSNCKKSDVIRFGSITELQNGITRLNTPFEQAGIYDKKDIEKKIFPYLLKDKNAFCYCPSLWAHAFNRKLFVSNMVEDKIQIGEDGACVIPCIYHANSMTVIHDYLYVYRYNNQSATKSGKVYDYDYPEKIYNHLVNKINLNEFDFCEQINRKIVHELFHVVTSHFNKQGKKKALKKELNRILDNPLYSNAINNCKFNSFKAKLLTFALKRRLYILFEIYNRIVK